MSTSIGLLITQVGLGGIMLYSVTSILNFFGYGVDFYGNYIAFYIFMWINTLVLDQKYKIFSVKRIQDSPVGPSVSISQEPSPEPSLSISQEPSLNNQTTLSGGNKYRKK